MLASPGVVVVVAYVPMLVSEVVNELEITSDVVSVVETGLEKVVAEVETELFCIRLVGVETVPLII